MKDLIATQKYISPLARRELKGGSKFQNGDTLFARITPCLENGKICQVKNLDNNVGFDFMEFLNLRGKENVSDNDFVYFLSWSEFVKNNVIQIMTGTSGRQRVEKSALEQLEIQAPNTPSNHLEKLTGKLSKFYSIRINKQWRSIFIWDKGNASEVEIIDYH
ncbi:MAG TPA: type II toxin-antitoxin system RelE/ParE family toxin [Saprospiraceae bacterium]|nr:type II toxin-antitoxin system RelE/ParE family toxin [Saprospiraceae bacterium]